MPKEKDTDLETVLVLHGAVHFGAYECRGFFKVFGKHNIKFE